MKKFSTFGIKCTPSEIANAHEKLVRRGYQQAEIRETGNFRGQVYYGAMGNVSFDHNPFSKYQFTRVVVTENSVRAVYWHIWNNNSTYYLKKAYSFK